MEKKTTKIFTVDDIPNAAIMHEKHTVIWRSYIIGYIVSGITTQADVGLCFWDWVCFTNIQFIIKDCSKYTPKTIKWFINVLQEKGYKVSKVYNTDEISKGPAKLHISWE